MDALFLHHPSLAVSGFWYAWQMANTTGIIICSTLFLLSVFSWTVMVTKMRTIRQARLANERFLDHFHHADNPIELYESKANMASAPLGHIYRMGAQELAYLMLGSTEADETFRSRLQQSPALTSEQMRSITHVMERAAGEVVLKLESQMTLLATAVSGAPFLGLLGTVWGVMESFSGVASSTEGATLQSMAPGVSAALVTTVIGLLVAIPAMFGYNYLISTIKGMIVSMDNFVSELSSHFNRHYVFRARPASYTKSFKE